MTPKEKAIDLVEKFRPYTIDDRNSKTFAIYCAKIAIKEILQTNPTIKGNSDDLITMIIQTKAYWYQVEEELNKM